MRSTAFFTALVLYLTVPAAFAFPGMSIRQNTNEKGVQITLPAQQNNGLKLIPGMFYSTWEIAPNLNIIADADHPYMAPGPTDQRGPCRKW